MPAFDLLWSPLRWPGLEHLRLTIENEVRADGLVVLARNSAVHRIHYQIECDIQWNIREFGIAVDDAAIHLRSDGAGQWRDVSRGPMRDLDGCTDVDISATPFTNTLPIRRLKLEPGQAAELKVVYCDAPTLRLTPARQRYTFLRREADTSVFLYEGLDTDFRAEITVDEYSLVLDYPGLWKRIPVSS